MDTRALGVEHYGAAVTFESTEPHAHHDRLPTTKFYHKKLEKVELSVEVRRSSANTQRFTNRPHELINNLLGCRYGFGQHFLNGLFETVGEAAISSALREVYLHFGCS